VQGDGAESLVKRLAQSISARQNGAVAERLDQGDFTMQMRSNAFPIYECCSFKPAAQRQAVGPPEFASL